MGSRLVGKVAVITGAARGQGRSHAELLAEEGADIVAIDLCEPIGSVNYPMPTLEDLEETGRIVEKYGRRAHLVQADVRDFEALSAGIAAGVDEFGRLDVVVANAGIISVADGWKVPPQAWRDVIDTNLTGVYFTVAASIPAVLDSGDGGSIVITGSLAAVKGMRNLAHYVSAKHGLIGLMKTMANELAEHSVRVNMVNPNTVDTVMVNNEDVYRFFAPDIEHPTREDASPGFRSINGLPVDFIPPRDVSQAVLFLASDDSRYVTGQQLGVEAGSGIK